MMHDSTCEVLEKLGADKEYLGRVIVPEHIPKARPPASAFAFLALLFARTAIRRRPENPNSPLTN